MNALERASVEVDDGRRCELEQRNVLHRMILLTDVMSHCIPWSRQTFVGTV